MTWRCRSPSLDPEALLLYVVLALDWAADVICVVASWKPSSCVTTGMRASTGSSLLSVSNMSTIV